MDEGKKGKRGGNVAGGPGASPGINQPNTPRHYGQDSPGANVGVKDGGPAWSTGWAGYRVVLRKVDKYISTVAFLFLPPSCLCLSPLIYPISSKMDIASFF